MVAKAQLDIELGGIAQLNTQMRSVKKISEDTLRSISQADEKYSLRKKEIHQQMNATLRSFDAKYVDSTQENAAKRLEIENRFQRQLYNLEQRSLLQRKHLLESPTNKPLGLSAVGHLAQVAGFYRTGHLIRAAGSLGVGSEMGVGTVAGVAALGGIAIAGSLVEKGFQMAASAAEKLATSLVGAISQIGGARNLQEMIVEGASTERMAAQIAANVTDKVTSQEVMSLMNKLSRSGEFTPTQIGAGISAFKARTGTFGPMRELGGFMSNLASVAGLTTEESGGILGQIMTQFPELSTKDVQQVAMNMWGLGRAGAVELRNAQDITEALGFAHKSGLGTMRGMGLEMGLVQLAQRFTGGQSADQAVTGVRRLQEELLLSPGSKKFEGLQQLLGPNFLTHDKSGQLVFKDEVGSLARLALASFEGKVPTKLIEERGQKALMGITTSLSAQFTPGMTESQKVKILEDTFNKLADGTITIDEFNGKLVDIQNTIEYKLKQDFNELSVQLEQILLPIIHDEVVPAMEKWVQWFKQPENIDKIKVFFEKFVTEGVALVNLLPNLATAVLNAAIKLATMFGGTVESHLGEARSKVSNIEQTIEYAKKDPRIRQEQIATLQGELEDAKQNVDFWESLFKTQHPGATKTGEKPDVDASKLTDKQIRESLLGMGEFSTKFESITSTQTKDLTKKLDDVKLNSDTTVHLSDETIQKLKTKDGIPGVDGGGRGTIGDLINQINRGGASGTW